jgi:hypothetical protein
MIILYSELRVWKRQSNTILSQAVKELAAMGAKKKAIASICADGGRDGGVVGKHVRSA